MFATLDVYARCFMICMSLHRNLLCTYCVVANFSLSCVLLRLFRAVPLKEDHDKILIICSLLRVCGLSLIRTYDLYMYIQLI